MRETSEGSCGAQLCVAATPRDAAGAAPDLAVPT